MNHICVDFTKYNKSEYLCVCTKSCIQNYEIGCDNNIVKFNSLYAWLFDVNLKICF